MMTDYQKIFKRTIDPIISSIFLVILIPLLIIISLVICLDSKGPVFFRQERLGKNGKSFKILKFRTMYVGSPNLRNPDGSCYNSPDDPRLTRIGKYLRIWSLDELPELFNVVKGDMSLVGPRPDQIDQIKYYKEEEKKRLLVKPGVTGWAQVHGRNIIPWAKRKQLDLEYVKNYSLLLDIKIIIKTIFYVINKKNIFTSQNIACRK